VGKKQNRAVLDANGLEVVVFPVGNEKFAISLCKYLNDQESIVSLNVEPCFIRKDINTQDCNSYIWKLHCKNIINNYKTAMDTFRGTKQEVALYVSRINKGNYNYIIVDFEQL